MPNQTHDDPPGFFMTLTDGRDEQHIILQLGRAEDGGWFIEYKRILLGDAPVTRRKLWGKSDDYAIVLDAYKALTVQLGMLNTDIVDASFSEAETVKPTSMRL